MDSGTPGAAILNLIAGPSANQQHTKSNAQVVLCARIPVYASGFLRLLINSDSRVPHVGYYGHLVCKGSYARAI